MKKLICNFKKLFSVLLILVLTLTFGCASPFGDDPTEPVAEGETVFTIYAMNDFHGCLFEDGDQAGFAKIGGYILDEKEKNPDTTIVLSAGDMFQGTAVSSLSRGRSVLDCMNYVGFDAMTIGNHEFDWGIEEVLKYTDGDTSNGEASFPIIVANVNEKSTKKLASWATPYAVFEKAGYKFGVIGIIGHDQTGDILRTYVEDYEFTDEFNAIRKYTKVLREKEGCDFVIVSAHCDTEEINKVLVSQIGEYKVDAILNGHTHKAYYSVINNTNRTAGVPLVQSGSYGKDLAKITLTVDNATREIVASSSINLKTSSVCRIENQEIKAIINSYTKEIKIASEEIGLSGEYIDQRSGGYYCANVLRNYDDAEIGICNSGGIRGNAFPIEKGTMLTYGKFFEISPFENKICLVSITGKALLGLLDYEGLFFSTNVDTNRRTVNGVPIDEGGTYRVATIDYLFVKTNYPFLYGANPVTTDVIFRDEIFRRAKENIEENGMFYLDK